MAQRVLGPTPLIELIPQLTAGSDGERDLTLYVEKPLALATVDTPVVLFELDDDDLEADTEDWIPDGYEYLLEAGLAAEAADIVSAWRAETGAPAPGDRERAAAVLYYAIFDAWLPVGETHRPMGGRAQWGGSAAAAADANFQTASELLARFPDPDVPTREEQWSVAPGDVVELMVWFAGADGPRAETRPVEVDSVRDDLIEARAVGADFRVTFRHDHVVGLRQAGE